MVYCTIPGTTAPKCCRRGPRDPPRRPRRAEEAEATPRGLVIVSALIASGQVAQVPYHLNRAMDNGLTQAQASEAITHLAFYVGWPNAFSALPVAKDVFEKRHK